MTGTSRLAAGLYGLAVGGILVTAGTTALVTSAQSEAQLGAGLPQLGSPSDALRILLHNSGLAIVVMLVARVGAGGSAVRMVLLAVAVLNLAAMGALAGSLGAALGLRFAIYAPLELAAFCLVGADYLLCARRQNPPLRAALPAFPLLAGAALAEGLLPPLV